MQVKQCRTAAQKDKPMQTLPTQTTPIGIHIQALIVAYAPQATAGQVALVMEELRQRCMYGVETTAQQVAVVYDLETGVIGEDEAEQRLNALEQADLVAYAQARTSNPAPAE
jgi:hypothetical protein